MHDMRGLPPLSTETMTKLRHLVATALMDKYKRMLNRCKPLLPHVAADAAAGVAYGLCPSGGEWVSRASLTDAVAFAVCLCTAAFGGRRLKQVAAMEAGHVTYVRFEGQDAIGWFWEILITVLYPAGKASALRFEPVPFRSCRYYVAHSEDWPALAAHDPVLAMMFMEHLLCRFAHARWRTCCASRRRATSCACARACSRRWTSAACRWAAISPATRWPTSCVIAFRCRLPVLHGPLPPLWLRHC